MRSINFPTAFGWTLAQGGTAYISLGPLSVRYHLVRGVYVYWRLRNAYTAGDFFRFRLKSANAKIDTSGKMDVAREILVGSGATNVADVDSALRQCYIPINLVPRDAKDSWLGLEIVDSTGASGSNGIAAFDVVCGDWMAPDTPVLRKGGTGTASGDGTA